MMLLILLLIFKFVLSARFLSSSNQDYFQDIKCPIKICTDKKTEMDLTGKFWPNYCYVCKREESDVIFRKVYLEKSWTYEKSFIKGNFDFQNRIVEKIVKCPGNGFEVDGKGVIWPL